MTLSIDQKRAFHERTHEVLQKTEYPSILQALNTAQSKKQMDEESFRYVVVSLFAVATQVRARTLGIDPEELRYTPEEMEANKKFFDDLGKGKK